MKTGNSNRSLLKDMSLGWHGRCPKCGTGHMFRAYLKVADTCANCGQELFHHRADDFPAYIVVSIVGHLMLSAAFWIEYLFKPDMWVHMAVLLPSGMLMTLALLQPVKGTIVALQWRMGMDGFRPKEA